MLGNNFFQIPKKLPAFHEYDEILAEKTLVKSTSIKTKNKLMCEKSIKDYQKNNPKVGFIICV